MNKDSLIKALVEDHKVKAKDIDGKTNKELAKFLAKKIAEKETVEEGELEAVEEVVEEVKEKVEEVKEKVEEVKEKVEEVEDKPKEEIIPEVKSAQVEEKVKLVSCKFIADLPYQYICGSYYQYKNGESANLPVTVWSILKKDKIIA